MKLSSHKVISYVELKINDSNPHYPQNSARYTLKANGIRLGPIHTRHFRAQYCDKKDIFGPWMSIGQGKLLSKHNTRYTMFL